jgi:tRNA(adenine34) deaminase
MCPELPLKDDEYFMRQALKEAQKAAAKNEVPIGAVVVKNGKIIGRGHNLRESLNDPTAHAEIIAIKKAAKKLKNWRLNGCTLYVTVEPCVMCAGAIILARLEGVVYGVKDPKAGAVASLYEVFDDKRLNHRVKRVEGGILKDECAAILKEFFNNLRG